MTASSIARARPHAGQRRGLFVVAAISVLLPVVGAACTEEATRDPNGSSRRNEPASSSTPPQDGSVANASGDSAVPVVPVVMDSSMTSNDAAVSDDTAPPNPCLDRTVCEDFEGTAVGQAPGAPWVVQSSKGTVKVDRTHVHGGLNALKVSIEATTSGDTYRKAMLALKGAPLIPLKDNSVYGRFFLWVDRVPDSSVHYTFASGSGQLGSLYAVYNYGGMGGLMANYYKSSAPDPTDCWQTKSVPFPTGGWKCVAFRFDGKNNELAFSLDGVDVPELHVLGNSKTDQTCTIPGVDGRWLAPVFDSVGVGWESYQHDAAGAHDAWIDDVILDDTPIGCAP